MCLYKFNYKEIKYFIIMGNNTSSNYSAALYDDLPSFMIDRQINNKIIIGINNKGSGIKFTNENGSMWYYEELVSFKKEKNYIEFLFNNKSSLIVYTKKETCMDYNLENESKNKELFFIFENTDMKFNGSIYPEYKLINFKNCEFDNILSI